MLTVKSFQDVHPVLHLYLNSSLIFPFQILVSIFFFYKKQTNRVVSIIPNLRIVDIKRKKKRELLCIIIIVPMIPFIFY